MGSGSGGDTWSMVAPMGSDLSIQRGLITSTDVYRRTDMHHDYMTSLLHFASHLPYLCL